MPPVPARGLHQGWGMFRLSIVLLAAFWPALLVAQTPGETTLREVPIQALSDRSFTPLAQAALSIRPTEWKHAETTNFIYHYFRSFVAAPVAVESEFYY